MDAPYYILAGGGTGGHLFPGIAVAHALVGQSPTATIEFLTTDRPLDQQLLAPTKFAHRPQPVRPFSAHPLHLPRFVWGFAASVRAARRLYRERRPTAVLGLGGYAAAPPVVAARRMGVRTAILNPDAVPGRANRYLARYTDLVVLQWEAAAAYFPAGTPLRTLGCPIRAEYASADTLAGRARFALAPDRPTIVATGASQGAHTLNAALWQVWPALWRAHREWQLLHLTGPADEPATRSAYAEAGVPAQILSFTHEMHLALAAADVVVSRAGASTLAELGALGKPSVLLPYPYHRDQHQRANAQVLVDAGAAILLDDQRDAGVNRGPLLAALERLTDSTRRRAMSAAARALARPNAADEVATWLLA